MSEQPADEPVMIDEPRPIKKGEISAVSEDGMWIQYATEDLP